METELSVDAPQSAMCAERGLGGAGVESGACALAVAGLNCWKGRPGERGRGQWPVAERVNGGGSQPPCVPEYLLAWSHHANACGVKGGVCMHPRGSSHTPRTAPRPAGPWEERTWPLGLGCTLQSWKPELGRGLSGNLYKLAVVHPCHLAP